jgi:hypothetical protein
MKPTVIKKVIAALTLLGFSLPASPALADLFFYKPDGSAEVGLVLPNLPKYFLSIKSYPADTFYDGWDIIVDTPNGIFFYDFSGLAAVGRLDTAGNFTQIKSYDVGFFAPGWTSIVNTPTGVLFYNRTSGAAAVGRFDTAGNFSQLRSYPNGFFVIPTRWTNIVNTSNGIFLYDGISTRAGLVRFDAAGNFTGTYCLLGCLPPGWSSIVGRAILRI